MDAVQQKATIPADLSQDQPSAPSVHQLLKTASRHITKEEYEEAIKILLPLAVQQNQKAHNLLHFIVKEADSHTQISEYFKQAINVQSPGYAAAHRCLGGIYAFGHGVPCDHAQAKTHFEQGAELKDPGSLFFLGYLYLKGFGGELDTAKAFVLFKEASDLGYGEAHFHVSHMYNDGLGVGQNQPEAAKYLEKAMDVFSLEGDVANPLLRGLSKL